VLAAGALPQTPLGELTDTAPDPLVGFEGAASPAYAYKNGDLL